MGIDRDDRKEEAISDLVREAPLHSWLRNPSFEDFYNQVRRMSQRLGCQIENIREASAL
jgi:pantoate kinase